MMTWHLDRLARSATACLVLAVALTVATAFFVDARSDVDSVLGGMIVGAVFIGFGGVVGSTVTSGAGAILFGAVAAFAQPGAPLLGLAGTALLGALMLVDLSITVRRAPLIDRAIWTDAAAAFVVVAAVAAVVTLVALTIGGLATWQAVVLPFGLVVVGFAVRFAVESHQKQVMG